jgi:hypothetical protein
LTPEWHPRNVPNPSRGRKTSRRRSRRVPPQGGRPRGSSGSLGRTTGATPKGLRPGGIGAVARSLRLEPREGKASAKLSRGSLISDQAHRCDLVPPRLGPHSVSRRRPAVLGVGPGHPPPASCDRLARYQRVSICGGVRLGFGVRWTTRRDSRSPRLSRESDVCRIRPQSSRSLVTKSPGLSVGGRRVFGVRSSRRQTRLGSRTPRLSRESEACPAKRLLMPARNLELRREIYLASELDRGARVAYIPIVANRETGRRPLRGAERLNGGRLHQKPSQGGRGGGLRVNVPR